ncbi:amidase/aspartyl-tRNA(Asn)/glutamyl-tRNA(Gln) amidotransferase subunit A [Ancylobacter aquaticus]|uniref:Amidase/aspartyl-tRNA(Asn)/glutamyl-tRNA(Gln) amidotransferase subunit A n=1 Tax=Ancylobacter aquaticus TaxID=100 RepID=A0A4R1I1V0_ANCAQ|nr:amidase family protein [Ancylobacter aquaticus]TCK29177.1 amidase/aspartyl-tRNA(Asn)/glutamyl-tRNA(Gln) amidotransferase subunit A [Ancylobacter aquaticus]
MSTHEEIAYFSIAELHRHYRAGTLSPVDVVDACLAMIETRDKAINAFVTVTAELAYETARRQEAQLSKHEGALPRLFGVPIGLKDLSDSIAGVRNTYGSRAFADFIAPRTADHVTRLLDAGAIPIGKTNTSEFGHKNTTDNYVVGPTSTPFSIGHNAGGSSGGSAAAAAAGMVSIGLGSDGGGSIRVPAAACGVYGFKPTFGQIPWVNRPNAMGTLAPFTHKGPLARSVADAIAMVDVMGQPMARDPFGPAAAKPSYIAALDGSLKGLKVGFAPTLCELVPHPDVDRRVRTGAAAFAEAGAEVEDIGTAIAYHYADIERIWAGLYDVFAADTARGLRGLDFDIDSPQRELLSPSLLTLIERGMSMSAMDFQSYNHERSGVMDAVEALFDRYDLILAPTNLVAAIPNVEAFGETFGPPRIGDLAVNPTIGWSLTYLFNLTGNPIASVPVGFSPEGVPVGMQIIGPRHGDAAVLAASAAFERHMPWHDSYARLGHSR